MIRPTPHSLASGRSAVARLPRVPIVPSGDVALAVFRCAPGWPRRLSVESGRGLGGRRAGQRLSGWLEESSRRRRRKWNDMEQRK